MQVRTEKLPDYLLDILKEMFSRVNAPVDNIDEFTKQPTWFLTYEWTKEQQDGFVSWLENYLKNNKQTFVTLTRRMLSNNKKNRLKIANEFVWNYGWKEVKQDNN
jgi:hypothetical protein